MKTSSITLALGALALGGLAWCGCTAIDKFNFTFGDGGGATGDGGADLGALTDAGGGDATPPGSCGQPGQSCCAGQACEGGGCCIANSCYASGDSPVSDMVCITGQLL